MDDFLLALLIWGVVAFFLRIKKVNGAAFWSIPFSLVAIMLYAIICMALTTTTLYTDVEVNRQNLAYDKNFETYCYTIANEDATSKNDGEFMVMYENGETKSIPKNATTIVKDDQNIVIVYDKTPSSKFLKTVLFDVQSLHREIHVEEVKTVIF